MNNFDLTFLEKGQVFGENRLDILKKYGSRAAVTDFSILLGSFPAEKYFTIEGTTLKDRTGYWYTKSNYNNGHTSDNRTIVNVNGNISLGPAYQRSVGVRPVLKYSLISEYASNNVVKNGVVEIEFGEYPQTVVDEKYSKELERLYNDNQLKQTGKKYTTDSVYHLGYEEEFCARTHIEYEYKGSKYIRFIGDKNGYDKLLSVLSYIEIGDVYWVKVEPITWLVDRKSDIALCKKIICSGVQFNN